jgi:hypothetical protein
MTQVAHVAHRQPIDGAELSAAATDLSTLSSRGPTDDMPWWMSIKTLAGPFPAAQCSPW